MNTTAKPATKAQIKKHADQIALLRQTARANYELDGGVMAETYGTAEYDVAIDDHGTAAKAWKAHIKTIAAARESVDMQSGEEKPKRGAGRRKVDEIAKEITEVMAQALDVPAEDVASLVKIAPAIPSTGYQGPMLALRDRIKRGTYQKAANGQPSCGDEVATILGACEPTEVIRACLIAMDITNPYMHLNVGQQSMNLRNKLRGQLKRGEIGMGVLREAVEEVVEGRPAKTPAPAAE